MEPLNQFKPNVAHEVMLGIGLLLPSVMNPDHVVTVRWDTFFGLKSGPLKAMSQPQLAL
jgi:hypothetical protein